jgi:hypothetical protein
MRNDHATVKSLEHLSQLSKHPYTLGEFLYNERGEIFLVEEAEELEEEISTGQISYGINWESEIWTESGIQIPAIYTE